MNPLAERKRPQITLELLVRKANQQWASYGCYSPQEKQLALDDARKLDKDPQTLAVRLIKETYDPEDNSSSEITLFASCGASTSRWASGFERRPGAPTAGGRGASARPPTEGKRGRGAARRPGLVARLLEKLRAMLATDGDPPPPDPTPVKAGAPEKGAPARCAPVRVEGPAEPNLRGSFEVMMKFVADAVAVLDEQSLNAFNRFGIALYVAGACKRLGRREGLTVAETATLLSTALFAIGLSKTRAAQFAAEHESYLQEAARNLQMFQAGHDAMLAHLGGGVESGHSLRAALVTWNAQRADAGGDRRRPTTLMFTDMVGSSAIADREGNEFAMKLIRVHNMIVKSAIGHYGGQYVKHTGDGILAAFDDARMAVKSAAVIQRCVREHNAEFPQLGLSLRIGLNGGDTIAEGDDLFGSSVNLASRMCSLAGPDQILCTGIVRDRAADGRIGFADRGEHAIKGFADPIPVYEVLWEESEATACAHTPKEEAAAVG